jgi:23S rRNA pseudouridine2605 synthase
MPGLVSGIGVFIHVAHDNVDGRTSTTVTQVAEHEEKSGERIAKVIARAGLASRREAELWIAAGRVAVNGTSIDTPARNVTPADRITVDGKPLPTPERTRLFLYHKRRGVMTTRSDPQGRPTVFAQLPSELSRLVSVGRLDFNTEGLLLLTNDGALARLLELPSTGWLRRYRVRAHGAVTQAKLDALRDGVTISGIHYGAIDAKLDRVQGANLWLSFAIREGKNREVRNVLGHFGLEVTRLIRVSFGPFQLGELAPGAIEEVRTRVLREQLGARLVALSGADFSAPRDVPDGVPGPAPALHHRNDPARSNRDDRKRPQSKSHSWRQHDHEHPPKPLRRKYHGARRDDAKTRQQPPEAVRQDVLVDRKGRAVSVERFGQRQPPQQPETPAFGRGRHGRRHAPDRASGPRPRHPRGPR